MAHDETGHRLAAAAAFVAALADVRRRSPTAWRRADAVGRTAGIAGRRLEQALADAVGAGMVDRRVDDATLVLLTSFGRAITERKA